MASHTLHLSILAALLAGPAPLLAQDALPDQTEAKRLDAITVSATRREGSIQTVPVAVTAIEGDALTEMGINDTQDLAAASPSLAITVSGNEAAGAVVRIRGIGTTGGNLGLEPAVGVFVDGVYRARSGIALTDLFDIDQVEVMRGPQSTLFGKNTSAGAISITTREPEFLPAVDLWGSVGNRDAYRFGAAVTGGVVDDVLALRVAAQYNQRDGFLHNTFDGRDYNDRDRWMVRAQALLTPSENVRLRLVLDQARKDEACCAAPYRVNGPTAAVITALGGTVLDPARESYDLAFDSELLGTYDDSGVSAHLDWTLGSVTLSGVLSYRDWTSDNRSDTDYNDLAIAFAPREELSNLYRSAEFSLKGEHGRVDWLVGAFLATDDSGVDGRLLFGEDAGRYFSALAGGAIPPQVYPAGTGQTRRQFRQEGESWSIFTHNVIDLGAGFDLTFGLRYADESKDGSGVVESNSPSCVLPGIPAALRVLCGAPVYVASYEDDRLLGTIGLSHTFGNDLLLYASYSQGFKAGGVNLDPTASLSTALTFEPETVDTWELGVKFEALDGDLRTRIAAFRSEFEDYQINSFNGIGFSIANEASVTAKGVEAEFDYTLGDHWQLRGGLTYNDATFGDDTTTASLRGQQVTNAPEWSGLLGVTYERRLSAMDASWFTSVFGRSQSEVNTAANLAPQAAQGGYSLFNARAGLRFDSTLEVALWANNLTDKFYNTIIFASVAQPGSFNGYVGEPRSYGIEVRKSF